MKTIHTFLLIPLVATLGLATVSAETSQHPFYPFDGGNDFWTDSNESRVNYSVDSTSLSQDYDQLPRGVAPGDSLQDPRFFLDDTHYWDDQMFGRSSSRVNFSISADDADDSMGINRAVYDDVFIPH